MGDGRGFDAKNMRGGRTGDGRDLMQRTCRGGWMGDGKGWIMDASKCRGGRMEVLYKFQEALCCRDNKEYVYGAPL